MSDSETPLRRHRTARAWSQQLLADASGVSLRTVQRAETGAAVSGETLLALAGALDLDVAAIQPPAVNSVSPETAALRQWRFHPSRVSGVGLALAAPAVWMVLGCLLYIATGWAGALPPLVSVDEQTFRVASEWACALTVGGAIAGAVLNAGAVLVRRDTRVNSAVVAGVVAALLVLGLLA